MSSAAQAGPRCGLAHASASDRAGAQYDRIGGPAWTLALSILRDHELAAQILTAAFVQASRAATDGRPADTKLLFDVRRRAITAASARAKPPRAHRPTQGSTAEPDAAIVPAAIAALPEPQREILEMALLGRLTVTEIANGTRIPSGKVIALLASATRELQPIFGRHHACPQPQHASMQLVPNPTPQSAEGLASSTG